MKFKTNLVLLAIVAVLGAFVYFYEIKGGAERQRTAARARELLSFKPEEARRLVIERQDTTIVLERQDGTWLVSAPVQSMADQQAVERYLRNILEAERERVVVDSAAAAGRPEIRARYGLDAPRLKVWLETAAGALDTLAFGQETPTERFAYVHQLGSNPEIFVVRAWRFDNLNKGLFELRDRRVLPFEKDAVAEFRLSRPQQQIAAVRERDGWRLKAPIDALADREAVDGLLSSLQQATVEAFVAEQADDETLNRYGLASSPWLEVSLLVGEDRAEKRLRIGDLADGGRYFARDLSHPQVFLVDSTLVNPLRQEVEAWRDKRPLKFPLDKVVRVELRNRDEPSIVAQQDTAGVWRIVAPEVRDAKSWKLSGLLRDLQQIEVAGFVQDSDAGYRAAEDKVLLTCTLSAMDRELLALRFVGQPDGELFLAIDGEPWRYRVDGEVFDRLNLTLEDVSLAASRPPVEKIDLSGISD